jgi:hypothetical protein
VPVLLIALGRAGVMKRLAPLLQTLPEGLDADARRHRAEALRAEIATAERAEELAIRRAAAAGVAIPRRGDADPAVVLAFDADLEVGAA